MGPGIDNFTQLQLETRKWAKEITKFFTQIPKN